MSQRSSSSISQGRRRAAGTLAVALILPAALARAAAGSPAPGFPAGRPIRIVVPYPPGGAADIVGRLAADQLAQALPAEVIVDNRAGAGGILGVQTVAQAPATGHDLLLGNIGPLTINPGLYPKLSYDAVRDFAPIGLVAGMPAVLAVQPGLGVDNVAQFIELLKARPGQLNYGSAGNGGLTHLLPEYFLRMNGVRAQHIPYKGTTPVIADFLGGRLDFVFDVIATAEPQIRAGKYKALAVTSLHRVPQLPDVPTLDELGWRGFDVTTWWGLLAPRGTPVAVVDRLNALLVRGLEEPALRERLQKIGAEPQPGSPQQFAAHIHDETARWRKVINAADIRPD